MSRSEPILKRWSEEGPGSQGPEAAAAELFRRARGGKVDVSAELLSRARMGLRRRVQAEERRRRRWLKLPLTFLALTVAPWAFAALWSGEGLEGLAGWSRLVELPARVLSRKAPVASVAAPEAQSRPEPSAIALPQSVTTPPPREVPPAPAPSETPSVVPTERAQPTRARARPKIPAAPPAAPELAQAAPATEVERPPVPSPEIADPVPRTPPETSSASDAAEVSRAAEPTSPLEQWASLEPRPKEPAKEWSRPSAVSAPPPSVSAPPPSAMEAEAALLSSALERLKRERDPKGAIALLDEHAARFPRGVLVQEAALARLGALLSLSDRDGALSLLETLSRSGYAGSVRGPELRVLHSELLAERGRCAEALSMLDTNPEEDDRRISSLKTRAERLRTHCQRALGAGGP